MKRKTLASILLQPSSMMTFLAHKYKIPSILIAEARKRRQIIYGAQAMNQQLPRALSRPTFDWDIYTHQPQQTANRIQARLDRKVAMGRDDYYSKRAIHKGTFKVMHEGQDERQRTRDDFGIVDYTVMQRVPTISVEGVRFQRLASIQKEKSKILRLKSATFRHSKDRADLENIRLARNLQRKNLLW